MNDSDDQELVSFVATTFVVLYLDDMARMEVVIKLFHRPAPIFGLQHMESFRKEVVDRGESRLSHEETEERTVECMSK